MRKALILAVGLLCAPLSAKTTYMLVTAWDAVDLELMVNNRLAEGWECLGGVATNGKTDQRDLCGRFYQAMVKREDEK